MSVGEESFSAPEADRRPTTKETVSSRAFWARFKQRMTNRLVDNETPARISKISISRL